MKDNQITKNDKLLKEVLPYKCEFLYKYRKMKSKNLDRTFTHNEIYFPSPLSFNDPFDCRPRIMLSRNRQARKNYLKSILKKQHPQYTKRHIDEIINKNPIMIKSSEVQGEAYEFIYKNQYQNYGIYCLSEIPDNILMWSHYTQSHEGICLQFKANVSSSLFHKAFKIRYKKTYPCINIKNQNVINRFLDTFFIKSKDWKYEQERRVIKNSDSGGPKVYTFQPEMLTGVILGAKIKPADENKIRKWAKKHETNIKIFKAQINNKEYKIDIYDNKGSQVHFPKPNNGIKLGLSS